MIFGWVFFSLLFKGVNVLKLQSLGPYGLVCIF